jgi:tetratricopeptide (TPR) repeat protein
MASEWHQKEARTRFILGAVLAETGEDEYAVELCRSALRYDPTLIAAHIHLGFTYAKIGTYEEMFGALREAVCLNSMSARRAVIKQPEEVALIGQLLNPHSPLPVGETPETVMPAEFVEAGNLAWTGLEHIAAGRYEEAIEALERSLRIDLEFSRAITLLTLAYLLLRKSERTVPIEAPVSVLFEIDAALARLIFKD